MLVACGRFNFIRRGNLAMLDETESESAIYVVIRHTVVYADAHNREAVCVAGQSGVSSETW